MSRVLQALAGAVAFVAVCVAAVLLVAPDERRGEAPGGSTPERTYVDSDGDGALERGPGEPLVDRSELAPASPTGRQLALFAQISDAHVRDEESPARLPFLDRLGPPFTTSFRPQEALSARVLAAAVESINRLEPDVVVTTGDLIDNAQRNELDEALAVLGGGVVDPESGVPGYAGVQSPDNPDPLYYRADVDAPRHPGLLALAQEPFESPGLRAPWYPVVGNHDVLLQGELAASARTRRVAVGRRAVTELDPALTAAADDERVLDPRIVNRLLARGLPGETARIPPDPGRRPLDPSELVGRLRAASGADGSGPLLDYSFDIGPAVRGIVLDLARRDAGSGGLVRPEQLSWLRSELERAGQRWVVVFSHQPLRSSAGGDRALELLDRSPRVVAAVAGHRHRNSIAPRRSARGGYWLVETASLADYPQQARAFRLVETASGVALESWMLDHTGGELAGVSRELAYLDAQGGRPRGLAGGRRDRNARLFHPGP